MSTPPTEIPPCASEDPGHPGLTCHLIACHAGDHYALGYRWTDTPEPLTDCGICQLPIFEGERIEDYAGLMTHYACARKEAS